MHLKPENYKHWREPDDAWLQPIQPGRCISALTYNNPLECSGAGAANAAKLGQLCDRTDVSEGLGTGCRAHFPSSQTIKVAVGLV